jgi:hypothetical protein
MPAARCPCSQKTAAVLSAAVLAVKLCCLPQSLQSKNCCCCCPIAEMLCGQQRCCADCPQHEDHMTYSIRIRQSSIRRLLSFKPYRPIHLHPHTSLMISRFSWQLDYLKSSSEKKLSWTASRCSHPLGDWLLPYNLIVWWLYEIFDCTIVLYLRCRPTNCWQWCLYYFFLETAYTLFEWTRANS